MQNKKIQGILLVSLILLVGWQASAWLEQKKESQSISQSGGDPFAGLVIPTKYTADTATKKVIEDKIAGTKAMYADKPDIWETWIAIGNLRALVEDFDGAIAAYKEANVRQQNNTLGFRNIAEIYSQHLKDYAAAATYYELALQNKFDDAELYSAFAFVQYKHLNNQKAAEETYLKGLQMMGNDKGIVTALIQFYKDTGNTEKYMERVRAFLIEHPDNAFYRDAYARELAAMGLKL